MPDKLNLPTYFFRTKTENGKQLIFDEVRKKFLLNTPEEWVRQNFINYLAKEKGFPTSLMVIETGLKINNNQFRADLLIYNRNREPLLICEFKAPQIKITQNAFDQISRYNMKLKVPYLVVSNGLSHYSCQLDFQNKSFSFLEDIPRFSEIC